ncbi:MAG: pyrroline-5-carboxylate reductase [Verrucomicrobiota bacterium]
MSEPLQLGFIGAGRMAQAMIRGLVERGIVPAPQIACTSAADGTGEAAAERFGIDFLPDPAAVAARADILVLAIKPQQLAQLPPELAEATAGKLIVSILAGTPLARLAERFPEARNLIRAMPNTPGMIGQGVTAYAARRGLSPLDRERAEAILGALGRLLAVKEAQLDAVTGVSGSGPAYLFEFVAALRDGGIAAGLDPEVAYILALETARGASELLREVPETPEQHRDWVSSPGGTTLAGLAVMEQRGFRATLRETVLAATARSRELAQS